MSGESGEIQIRLMRGGTLFAPYSMEECSEALGRLLASDLILCGNYNQNKIRNFDNSVAIIELHLGIEEEIAS